MNTRDRKNEQAPQTERVDLSTKSRLLTFVLGIFIGLAVIIPGVSGSTIAIIFGLYTAMLYAMGNVFTDFKRCVLFLIPLVLGAAIGFLGGFILIQKIFGKYLFFVVCLFVGLMVGALPAVTREIKGAKLTPLRGVYFPLGVLIPIAIGAISILLSAGGESTETFTSFPVWRYLVYLPLGFVVSATQIIPGLSATALLMAFGQFGLILNSLHLDYILENPQVLGLYAALGVGFLAGLVVLSKLFSGILTRHKTTAFFLISGLSVGSVISMFINTDMMEVYASWGAGQGNPLLQIALGVLLLIVGFVPSFLLTRYELKHNP